MLPKTFSQYLSAILFDSWILHVASYTYQPGSNCLTRCLHLPNATKPIMPADGLYTVEYMKGMCSATMAYARCVTGCDIDRAEEAVVDTMEDRWTHCSRPDEVLRNQQCFRTATRYMSDCYLNSCKSQLHAKIQNWSVANDSEKTRQLEGACKYWQCSHSCLLKVNGATCTEEGLSLVSAYGQMAIHYWLKKLHLYANSLGITDLNSLYGRNCCQLLELTKGWAKCTSPPPKAIERVYPRAFTTLIVTLYALWTSNY